MLDRKLKLLFIANMYPPEIGAAAVRASEYAKALQKRGHDITILTGFPNYPDGKIYSGYKNAFFAREEVNGITVYRTLTFPNPRKRFLFRLAGYFVLALSNLFFISTALRFDAVIGWQTYVFTFLTGEVVAKLQGVPFAAEIEDFVIERAFAVGQTSGRLKARLALGYDRFIFERSDAVVVTTEPDRRYVLEQTRGLTAERTKVVENGVVTDMFAVSDPEKEARIRADYGLEGKFVVSCVGNFGLTQGLDKFLQAAKLLSDDDRFRFVFVGFGVTRHVLEEIARREGLTNVALVEKQPREEVPYFLNVSDVAVCSLEDSPPLNRSFPSRIAEYLAAGLPILILAKGEPRRIIVEEAGAGVYADKENPAEVAETLRCLADDPGELKAMGERGRVYACEYLEREKLADKLDAFLVKTVRSWRWLKYK
ncbi:MAG: glycosyltransferase family 4 protein [Candidatus Coatesbacteria bacterium]|nr:MAG: glycosyltransferase family 4 protein [Candidatus Coatesbacteria bacterium]